MNATVRGTVAALLLAGAAGCLLASGRDRERPSTTSLTAARLHASAVAPPLPVFVLRVARDDLALAPVDRANVAMIAENAQAHARTLYRARAAFLEVLARSADHGEMDENYVAVLTQQMGWASAEVAPRLRVSIQRLHDVLSTEQRTRLVATVRSRLPEWGAIWASDGPHRWLDGFPTNELFDFEGDLTRTSTVWAVTTAADVREALPELEPSARHALALSLRQGAHD